MDTSCYTTSVAAVALDGHVLGSARRLLVVKMGGRGLRQSEGVFQHVQNLPELIAELSEAVPGMEIAAVCASDAPRDGELPPEADGKRKGNTQPADKGNTRKTI